MFSSLSRRTRNFFKARTGNIAMIAALTYIPIMGVLGLAVDFRMVEIQRTKVQSALDNAMLFAARGRQDGMSENEVRKAVRENFTEVLKSNGLTSVCATVDVSFDKQSNEVTGKVRCSQDTVLGMLVGKPYISYDIDSAIDYGIGKLDVVFVFDSSGSMAGSRLTSLKKAARDAVDTILPPSLEKSGDIRIAMVAYNDMVNAGSLFDDVTDGTTYQEPYGSSFWTANPGSDDYCTSSFYFWGTTYYSCQRSRTIDIKHGCVYERGGSEAFTAALPGPGKWIQHGGKNDDGCPWSKVQPLTNIRGQLISYIATLGAEGGTAGHQGIAWGWYLIAPEWSSLYDTKSKPMPYDEPDSTKVIIMMTDGEFNSQYFGGQGNSDQQARKLCDAIKAQGDIVIYTIAFQAPKSGQKVLEYCKSDDGMYFSANNSEQLEDAYRQIATSISDLRLSL